jgi:very-short-patch-repair endonuclease
MTNKIIPYEKSFASHEKAQYWSDKNDLKPDEVFKSSARKYIFDCNNCNHEFISRLDNIINNKWCGYCANQKLCENINCNICFEKSFASHEKAQYWSNKNELQPTQVFKNSNKKFIFDCECKHEITIALNNNNWCSFCSNPPKQLCSEDNCNTCFEKSFASHEKAQYWSDKNEFKPRNIFKNAYKKYIFNCDKCNHEILISPANITSGNWCAYCANQTLCENINCSTCFNKSFASHEKAQYWSNDKNEFKPIQVFKYTNLKYIFNCNICNHSFENSLNNICSKNQWCPYCAKPCHKLCENNDCNFCFNNSFASHEKSKEFSKKNNLNPRFIFKGSSTKYIFTCNKCHHEYNTIIGNESWCSFCSNKKLCETNNCILCFNKSFASHHKSKYWSDKNELKPIQIFKGTHTKFIFNCNKCNKEFNTSINKITGVNRWCPYCVNKTEQKLYDKLINLYPTLQQQFKVDWCKNINYLPFDFVIPDNKIIIELDGRQHFEQVSNWDDPQKTQENDKYKMKCANDNNYSVIRILQEDVFYDSYDWLSELDNNIKKLIKYDKIQNIYMCQDNEYDIFN